MEMKALKGKKYCNRCTWEMWYDETKKKWYCTNPKCVKYKEPPVDSLEGGEDTTDAE